MKALLKNYHQAPRKVRLVADLIRGKSVAQAREALTFLPKKSSPVLAKLLNSAVANAGRSADDLFVKTITVDKGAVMKRGRPFSRGRSGTLHKELSIIFLELGTNVVAPKSSTKKTAKPKAKKTAAKKAESASAMSSSETK